VKALLTASLLSLVACAIIGATPSAQGRATPPEPQTTTASPPTFSVKKTPDGDYVVKYLVGTEERSFTFVPNTKIVPTIASTVVGDPGTATYTYSYEFTNGADAKQQMAVVDMVVLGVGSARMEAPVTWRFLSFPTTNRLLWMRDFQADRVDGLAPGDRARGFRIVTDGSFLPGPENAGCKGNIITHWPDDVPGDVLSSVQGFLRGFVSVPVISPSIAVRVGDADLPVETLLLRILGPYDFYLENSRHPSTAGVLAAMREALQQVTNDRVAAARALDRARQLALATGQDPWAQSLGQGLALCIDFVKARLAL
jgi:hypothetical protein